MPLFKIILILSSMIAISSNAIASNADQVEELLLELIKLPSKVDRVVSGLSEDCHNLEADLENQSKEIVKISREIEFENRDLQAKRFHLFVKIKNSYNQFTDEYLMYVGQAAKHDKYCKDSKYLVSKDVCDQAEKILAEFELKKSNLDQLINELKASNIEFDKLFNLVERNISNRVANKIRNKDIFYKNISETASSSDLEDNFKLDISRFKSFLDQSVDAFSTDLIKLSNKDIFRKHQKSLEQLAKSPMDIVTRKEINLRLVSRSEKLLDLNAGQAIITFDKGSKSDNFSLNSNNISREFRSQEQNSIQAYIHHRKTEDELDATTKDHGEPFSLKEIKDQLSEYAWVRDFVQNYHEDGVSQVPSPALQNACKSAKKITGQPVCSDKSWAQTIRPFLEEKLDKNKNQCLESAISLRKAQLDYIHSSKRTITDIINQFERNQNREITQEEFRSILSHELPKLSSKLSLSLGVTENSELFKTYLDKLSKKDQVNPNMEIVAINAIASNFVIKNETERVENCNLFGYLDAVKIKPKPRIPEERFLKEACEQARKEIENAPECPPIILGFGDWLEKQFDSFKKKVKSLAEKIKDAVGKMERVAKKAYYKSLSLAQDFVAITSRLANATSQVVFDQSLDWDETKEHSGVSDWFNNTTNELSELGEKFIEKSADGTIKLTKATVNLGEATINFIEGDKDSAKRALRRGKENSHDGFRSVGKAGEAAYKSYYIAVAEAPFKLVAGGIDSLTGKDLEKIYEEERKKVMGEIKKGTRKVGKAMEAAGQPENIGRIALVYGVGLAGGGPFASAAANALYDKYVLGKDMNDKDMLKSVAIGGISGSVAQNVTTTFGTGYGARIASNMAERLTRRAGNKIANNEDCDKDCFLKDLGGSFITLNSGEGAGDKILDETVEAIGKNVVDQTVDNDFKVDEIDFDSIEEAAIGGFANGVTRQAVEGLVDGIIAQIPKEKRKPTPEEREKMIDDLQAVMEEEAKAQAIVNLEDKLETLTPEELVMVEQALKKKYNNSSESSRDPAFAVTLSVAATITLIEAAMAAGATIAAIETYNEYREREELEEARFPNVVASSNDSDSSKEKIEPSVSNTANPNPNGDKDPKNKKPKKQPKKKDGTPKNNQAQNKQFRDATQGLSKDQKTRLHREISGKNFSYQEIKEIVDLILKGKYW